MQGNNHTDVVADAKRFCEGWGISLRGACGAFEITKRVAWMLRGERIGLLAKPTGENCVGYAAGYLVYADGTGVDILGDAGGANTPQWVFDPPDTSLAERWRMAVDPGDEDPAPSAPPPPATTGLSEQQYAFLMARLDALGAQLDADTEKIQQQIDQVVKNAEASAAAVRRVLEPLLPALTGLFAGK